MPLTLAHPEQWSQKYQSSGALAHVSALLVVVFAILALLKGIYNARRRAPVVDVEIPIPNLPAAFAGFTIVQLSDIHVGRTIRKSYIDAIVDKVMTLDTDMRDRRYGLEHLRRSHEFA